MTYISVFVNWDENICRTTAISTYPPTQHYHHQRKTKKWCASRTFIPFVRGVHSFSVAGHPDASYVVVFRVFLPLAPNDYYPQRHVGPATLLRGTYIVAEAAAAAAAWPHEDVSTINVIPPHFQRNFNHFLGIRGKNINSIPFCLWIFRKLLLSKIIIAE